MKVGFLIRWYNSIYVLQLLTERGFHERWSSTWCLGVVSQEMFQIRYFSHMATCVFLHSLYSIRGGEWWSSSTLVLEWTLESWQPWFVHDLRPLNTRNGARDAIARDQLLKPSSKKGSRNRLRVGLIKCRANELDQRIFLDWNQTTLDRKFWTLGQSENLVLVLDY